MSFLFTTHWGAIYLAALVLTMLPAILWRRRYMLATTMVFLWLLDRLAVTFLPVPECLAFLTFAYLALSITVAMWKPSETVNSVVSFLLALSVLPFAFATFGALDWDATGTLQEILGGLSMLAILLWPRHDGSRVSDRAGHVDRHIHRPHRAGSAVAESEKHADSNGHS